MALPNETSLFKPARMPASIPAPGASGTEHVHAVLHANASIGTGHVAAVHAGNAHIDEKSGEKPDTAPYPR